jgi:hypothetical protein
LFRAKRADSRPIPIGRPRVSGAGCKLAVGPSRAGPQQSGDQKTPHSTLMGCGLSAAIENNIFSLEFLQNTVLIVFCPNFGKISTRFFYSNYSNENLLRK